MSSYFDTASRMVSRAFKENDEATVERVVQQVIDTYGDYLTWIGKKLPRTTNSPFTSPARQAIWDALRERWLKIISGPLVSDMDRSMHLSMKVENLHDFAHAVGSADLRTRDGRPILDNPYLAAKASDIVIQEQRKR